MAWITFSYDDGLKNNYHVALPLHEQYGIPASLAIIAHRAVSPEFWDRYMTPQEIVDADARGHEIVSHGVYHKNKFTEISDEELSFELSYSKEILSGFVKGNVSAINIPFARYDPRVLEEASKHYEKIRLAGDKLNDIGGEKNLISAHAINSKSTLDRVKKLIDRAVSEDKWLVLMFHGITGDPEPKGMYSNTSEFLEQSLSYAKEYIREGSLKPVLFKDTLPAKEEEVKKNINSQVESGEVLAEGEGYLITYHPAKVKSDKLIISFGGLPSSKTRTGFGSDFAIKSGYHHIFVAQAPGSQYQELSLEAFRDAVMPICEGKDVYTYGSSLGGYCAIYYAGIINAQAIAAAPKNSAHPSLKHNLKKPVEFKHHEMVDTPKSDRAPIIIYDPYQREESRFIEKLILPAYPNAELVKVPYSGHLVLQVMSNHKLLKLFLHEVINKGVVIPVEYVREDCHIWNYEKGRVLFREGKTSTAVEFLERSISIKETRSAKSLLEKITET